MKIVNKKITAEREEKALLDSKKNGFPVAFGDKSLFDRLRIVITRESCNETRTFEIAPEHLPTNKTHTTRFYLKESEAGVAIKWCSKVAASMHEVG